MRPYLGILKDSYREALSSKVLWITLAMLTLFLAAIAPFTITESLPTKLDRSAVANWPGLAYRLADEGAAESLSPAKAIWTKLNAETRKSISEIDRTAGDADRNNLPNFPFRAADQLQGDLNRLIDQNDLYSADAWKGVELPEEAKELLAKDLKKLGGEELQRFNRLALESAFPSEIPTNKTKVAQAVYFAWKLGDGLPVSKTQLRPILRMIVNRVVNFIVGSIGSFAALLVTASMITQTFEAGSIDLLLSKPVSRSLVFLTKFAGGSIFIGLNALYFIAGMWLIVGWRFDLWIHKLWWCIPVLLFQFIVFYSVCALGGLLFRNTIVAILITIGFFGLGGVVWIVKSTMESVALMPRRIVNVAEVGTDRIAVSEQGQFRHWNGTAWEDVLATKDVRRGPPMAQFNPEVIGPVASPTEQRVYAVVGPSPGRRGGFQLFAPTSNLIYGDSADGWIRKEGPNVPAGTRSLFFDPENRLLAVATDGIFRLEPGPNGSLSKKEGKFQFVGPMPRLKLDDECSSGIDPSSGRIVTFSKGELTVLERRDEGKYEVLAQRSFTTDSEPTNGVCLVTKSAVLLVEENGHAHVLNSDNLETTSESSIFRFDGPRFATTSSDGRWGAFVSHAGHLGLFDAQEMKWKSAPVSGAGDLSAVQFDSKNQLLLADQGVRLTRYETETLRSVDSVAPAWGMLEYVYYYVINPLYTTVRKPVELDNVSTWLLTDKDSVAIGPPNSTDMRQVRIGLDVWGTIYHSLTFVCIVLGFGCLYVSRRDF